MTKGTTGMTEAEDEHTGAAKTSKKVINRVIRRKVYLLSGNSSDGSLSREKVEV